MLFYKKFQPFTYRYRRGSGRSSLTGRITSWHRRALRFTAGRSNRSFLTGLFKVYRLTPDGYHQRVVAYAVNQTGLILGWPALTVQEGYLFFSIRPAVADRGVVMPLRWIPVGLRVCQSGYHSRSNGCSTQLLRHRGGLTQVKLPSKKILWLPSQVVATVGVNANSKTKHLRQRRAGDLVFAGRRPRVRGVAMNPVDHPHGGGQGKTSGGRCGVSPWGQLTKGYKTRH